MGIELSDEQKQIIHHPLGKHARVMAVAGSGKTTTMVHRIYYLIKEKGISPENICILMFNHRARIDFQKKLEQVLNDSEIPRVNTFHSYAYGLIQEAIDKEYLPQAIFLSEEREEQYLLYIHGAIQNLEKKSILHPDDYPTIRIKNLKTQQLPTKRSMYV